MPVPELSGAALARQRQVGQPPAGDRQPAVRAQRQARVNGAVDLSAADVGAAQVGVGVLVAGQDAGVAVSGKAGGAAGG